MLIIISGSAGVGKNTIITHLLENHPNIKLIQTCTTRVPRHTDKDMHNPYIYITREDFEQKIKDGELFEHEEILLRDESPLEQYPEIHKHHVLLYSD